MILNSLLNRIHEWGEPDKSLVKRIVFTRLGSTACLPVEVVSLAFSSLEIAWNATLFSYELGKKVKRIVLREESSEHLPVNPLKNSFFTTCKLIVSIASTLIIGVILSPELNFRLHLKLGLAVDNLSVTKQKELQIKLETQRRAEEITKARAARFAKFEAERQAAKDEEIAKNAFDAHLAELLMPDNRSLA